MRMRGSLVVRLVRHGCTNRPFFHVVVMERYKNQHKPPIEQLGTYDPMPNNAGEKCVAINFDRLRHYLGMGATTNRNVATLLGYAGFYPMHPRVIYKAKEKRRLAEKQALEENETREES